jgi:hypothetical protein
MAFDKSLDMVAEGIGYLSREVQYKILRGNAQKLYRFIPAELPVLADA